MTTAEQYCYACHNVMKLYRTVEYMAPWHCKCQKKQISSKRSVQQLISHQCKCPVRTLKVSGRRIVYCRCE